MHLKKVSFKKSQYNAKILPMNPEDKSQIEELKKSLYSRNVPDIRTKRKFRYEKKEFDDVHTDWEHPKEDGEEVVLNKEYKDRSMSFITKFFVVSIIFFLLAIGIGTYLVLNGANIVSGDNIDITVSGPVSVPGGTPISFDIQVSNKNNIRLENVELVVDFPAGSVDANNSTKELKEFREVMQDIEPGGIGQKTVKVIVYGQENSSKEVLITVSYKVKGSNSVYKKQKEFEVLLNSSPLSLSVESFTEITSGQTFDIKVTLISNSKDVLKNLVLKGVYPSGFTFVSSDPAVTLDNSTWKIGDIPSGEKKTITIRGILEGQNEESRIFRFVSGAQSQSNKIAIGTEFISATQELSIKKPFVTVGINFEGNSDGGEYVGNFNTPTRVEITWFNNLPTSINNGEIRVKLSGNAFDKVAVSPEQGLYRSADNEIVWNSITTPELGSIGAGESGKVSFNITPRDTSTSFKGLTNPSISLVVDVSGKRSSESNVPETVVSGVSKNIKISSNASLSSQILYFDGPFVNTGSIPPKAEKPTTYTVVWTVDNTSNTLSGAYVHSSLPANVKWADKKTTGEDITYNKSTGEILWKVGSVNSYTFNNKTRRQVAFQVMLEPSITDVGSVLNVINSSTMRAVDDFTGKTLTDVQGVLTTRFSTDSKFKDGNEIVTR